MKLLLPMLFLMSSLSYAKTFKLMQYNVENLFDTRHDQNKEDYVYLPLNVKNSIPGMNEYCANQGSPFNVNQCLNLDWTEAKLQRKLQNIAQVIRSYDNSGLGPDVVVIEEIENRNVLNQLATRGLNGLYRFQVLLEGEDERGIDIGILSKYPVITAQRYPLVVNGQRIGTRGITGVALNVEGKTVAIFGNHWPSQSNPIEFRQASARMLNDLAKQSRADLIVAAGDFNTLPTDTPSPFNHLVDFIDAEREARKINRNLHPGTHFFKGHWSSLDHIFIHKSSKMRPRFDRFQIMNRPFMMKRDERGSGQMIPNRFDFDNATGYADHLPMTMEFEY
ncbi:endonuclease/exonuclease/phosphatase family protein [Peredibacter sp. HCB2-198]|uniref:endonuclease/exonuclease/phosphatase family protein n=1 Tax=Peredibacter sp. HCB2-198 TaxID=3383025 RepID=UPI0038B53A83